MDKKDEIILQQLDVIRTMTQNNLNRMGSDFWGAPLTPRGLFFQDIIRRVFWQL